MWYQLTINKKNASYKIGPVKKCFEAEMKIFEEREKSEPSFCQSAIYYNDIYYFSKNKNALIDKLKELGWIYATCMAEKMTDVEIEIDALERKIAILKNELHEMEKHRNAILKKFAKYDFV